MLFLERGFIFVLIEEKGFGLLPKRYRSGMTRQDSLKFLATEKKILIKANSTGNLICLFLYVETAL